MTGRNESAWLAAIPTSVTLMVGGAVVTIFTDWWSLIIVGFGLFIWLLSAWLDYEFDQPTKRLRS